MCDLHGKIGVASEFSVSDLSVFRHETPISGSDGHHRARSPSRRFNISQLVVRSCKTDDQ